MTYLELVNSVLIRLRESVVSSVTQTDYSTLIGAFVNESKRQVEDAWEWDALQQEITVTTSSGVSNYVVTGSGRRHKSVVINDTTNHCRLLNVPIQWIKNQQQLSTVQNANPGYYAWSGNNGTDDKIELYPTPNGAFNLVIAICVPQVDLSADADILTIQPEAVIAGAYARALVERGEDGGLNSSEAYGLYKGILSDQIAIEASRQYENSEWVAV
jgi:hypothetical protein